MKWALLPMNEMQNKQYQVSDLPENYKSYCPPIWLPIFMIIALFALTTISEKVSAKPLPAIIVAMHIEPPFSDMVDGEFVGENIDIANALADKIGRKVKFVYCPVARCFSLVQAGHADMIIAVRKTAIREQFMSYLSPPIKIQKLPLRFYIRADHMLVLNNYDDLHLFKVGVLRGASYFDKFDHDTNIAKIPLTNHQQLINMLLKGRIDTFLEREESITPLVDKHVYATKIKLAKFSYDKSVGSYIAISKKSALNKDLNQLSTALASLAASGYIAELIKKTKQVN